MDTLVKVKAFSKVKMSTETRVMSSNSSQMA